MRHCCLAMATARRPPRSASSLARVVSGLRRNAAFKASTNGGLPELNDNLIKMADRFINVKDLDIDLIDSINPFQLAYEVMSKSVDADVLKRIHGAITARRVQMSEEEAVALWPRIKSFNETHAGEPSLTAQNPMERRLGEALEWIRAKKRDHMRVQKSG